MRNLPGILKKIIEDGFELAKRTKSPVSDQINKTSIPGLFVCGNAFKVYDLADSVSHDSIEAGRLAAEYLKGLQ